MTSISFHGITISSSLPRRPKKTWSAKDYNGIQMSVFGINYNIRNITENTSVFYTYYLFITQFVNSTAHLYHRYKYMPKKRVILILKYVFGFFLTVFINYNRLFLFNLDTQILTLFNILIRMLFVVRVNYILFNCRETAILNK